MAKLTDLLYQVRQFASFANLDFLESEFYMRFKMPEVHLVAVGNPITKHAWNAETKAYDVTGYDTDTSEEFSCAVNLEDYIRRNFLGLQIKVEANIFHELFTPDKSEIKKILKATQLELEAVKKHMSSDLGAKYPYVKGLIDELYNSLLTRYKMDQDLNQNRLVPSTKTPKIRWLGNINTLTTFLLQLKNGDNTIGKALIDCEISDLKKMVLENFLNKNGEPIKQSVIDTYFDTNKQSEDQAKREQLVFDDRKFTKRKPKPTIKKSAEKYMQPVAIPKKIN